MTFLMARTKATGSYPKNKEMQPKDSKQEGKKIIFKILKVDSGFLCSGKHCGKGETEEAKRAVKKLL